MQLSTLAKRGSLVLFLALIAFYLYGLGHLPLIGPDEPRYAQIAREMFLRGDLVTPTLGGHLWFEKPALLYWMMIASYKLFGVSEWSARLPGAVSGLLTVAAVYCIGQAATRKQISDRLDATPDLNGLGFWSAIAAGTTLGIVVFSRAASFDIVVTMTLTWALAFFIMGELQPDDRKRGRYLAGFYVFMGLSLLAKGLIGIVIPLGVVGAYYLFSRRFPERKTVLSLLWGIPVTLAVAAVWYGPVILKNGWPFVDQFFVQHQFARYVSNKYRHPAPPYFYLVILLPLALPWTAFFVSAIVKGRSWRWRAADRPAGDGLLVFGFAWFLVPVVFFSFANSKLPGYILPALPAMALIAGHELTRFNCDWQTGRWAMRVTAALSIVLAAGAPIYIWRSGLTSLTPALMIAMVLGPAGIFALLMVRHRAGSVVLIAAATIATLVIALHWFAPQPVDQQNSKRLLQLADARGYAQTQIYGLRRDDRSPEFYAAGRISYGPDNEPVMYESAQPVITESLRRKEALLVFVTLKDLEALVRVPSAHFDVIGNNGKVAIVAVRAKE